MVRKGYSAFLNKGDFLNPCRSGLKRGDSKAVPLIALSARVTFCSWGSWEAATVTPNFMTDNAQTHYLGNLRREMKAVLTSIFTYP